VVYCSKECQKAHWKVHKPVCGKTRAALLRYDDGTPRSPALIRQIERLQSEEVKSGGITYLLFTDREDDSDIGITFTHKAGAVMFEVLKARVFSNRRFKGEVRRMYEMLKARLPGLVGRFSDADLRRQLKAEYGVDPMELNRDSNIEEPTTSV
jgi:hypothetical protein